MPTPHKHAALIKAWADGASIQTQLITKEWRDVLNPNWSNSDYRITPEPEPDGVTDEPKSVEIVK